MRRLIPLVATLFFATVGAGAPAAAAQTERALHVPPAMRDGPISHLTVADLNDSFALQHLRLTLPVAQGGSGFTHVAADTETGGVVVAVKDTDGDGARELVVVEYRTTFDERFEPIEVLRRIAVISGIDGDVLWRSSVIEPDGNLYIRVADVDGAPGAEIVTFDSGYTSNLSDDVRDEDFDQIVTVRDGSTGAVRFTHIVHATMTQLASPPLRTPTITRAEALVGQVLVAPADAAGEPRLLVTRQSFVNVFTHTYVVGVTPPRGVKVDTGRCATVIDLLDAAGSRVSSIDTGERALCGTVLPISDQTGDGDGDLVFTTPSEMQLLGRDGTEHWRSDVALDDDIVLLRAVPVRGAATQDITALGINVYIYPSGGAIVFEIVSDHAAAFSGIDGAHLIDRRTEGYLGFVSSAVRPGGTDVIDITWTDTQPLIVTIASGQDDGTLWQRAYGDATYGAALRSVGDVDGEPGDDVIVVKTSATTGRIDAALWAGDRGSDVWHLDAVTFAEIPGAFAGDLPSGHGDIDGDGREDLATWSYDDTGATVTFRDGLTLDALASLRLDQPDGVFRFLYGMRDLHGAPGAEGLVGFDESDGTSSIELRAGTALLWRTRVGIDGS